MQYKSCIEQLEHLQELRDHETEFQKIKNLNHSITNLILTAPVEDLATESNRAKIAGSIGGSYLYQVNEEDYDLK